MIVEKKRERLEKVKLESRFTGLVFCPRPADWCFCPRGSRSDRVSEDEASREAAWCQSITP